MMTDSEYAALTGTDAKYALSHKQIIPLLGPACRVPGYVTGDIGDGWTLKACNIPVSRGYFSPVVPCPENPVLSLHGTVFMSVTPVELESHWLPLHEAHGNTVIAGLGMALIVLNLLDRAHCDKIVVLEHSQALIDAYPELLSGYSRALWEAAIADGNLTVLHADCRKDLPLTAIAEAFEAPGYYAGLTDHLYVDIWPTLHSDEALPDTRALCDQLAPHGCTFWGQELELAAAIGKPQDEIASAEEIRTAIAALGLPLSVREWEDDDLSDYSRLISAAVYATLMR